MKGAAAAILLGIGLSAAWPGLVHAAGEAADCGVSLVVLGIAQDAGRPQLGHPEDPAWKDASLGRLATAIAAVDSRGDSPRRWLFEATPDVKVQLQRLDEQFPAGRYIGLDGIFLTHAHMGHYTGLVHFGFEAARTDSLPVYAMPEMKRFLETNGPWDQLVNYGNIAITELSDKTTVDLGSGIGVMPFAVPHRREYSETVGFVISGPRRSALFLPDINSWEVFEAEGTRIETLLAQVDIAFVDATFYGDELPNISAFPHPKILESMARFDKLPPEEKAKVRFIHLNHSNPALLPGSRERQAIGERGYAVAEELEQHCL